MILALIARVAAAAPDDAAYHEAERRAVAGEPGAIDAFEAIGAARPTTRWTDNAWAEAARLAERAGDFDRARRDLAQAIATATDDQLAKRARGDLARLDAIAGATGQWSAVAAAHEKLVARIAAPGDPKPALADLEALVRANPGYPRAATAMLVIAGGWERDGDFARALAWLREAAGAPAQAVDHEHAVAELARGEIRAGELAAAEQSIAAVARLDPALARVLGGALDRARHRRWLRWALWAALAAIALGAVVALRRAAGSWRAAARGSRGRRSR